MTAVAFLGLGRMGAPMAANLAAAGHQLVLFNRTAAKADALASRLGAVTAPTPRDAVLGADVVITMLADEAALLEVCDGPGGVLSGLRPATIVADMGTTGPAGVGGLAPRVAAAGGVLIDAPVSGSTAAAEAGTLTILVGAPEEHYARIEGVLAAMGDHVFHLGDTGAGSVMKLAVNNIVYALGNALSESLVLAERAGLERRVVYEVFEHSAIAAPMVRYRHDAFLDPEHTPAAFAMYLARKDLGLITDLAASVDLEVEQAQANLSLLSRAIEAGLGEKDMADVAVYLRGSKVHP
ncbi:MAG: NAD(P)-dependent oxidoreductase [Nitriliruptoraceae bacterium]